ncbi:PDR/VanB family oxidoreductase [Elioraea sp.]|uniref:PDR/VanB family oxidoreductase n=1 Tax=Elioraea sp. TaxID=2185103 RepID=UPI003F6E8721
MTATLDLVVATATPVAEDVHAFRLVQADGAPLPPFTSGAHVVLHGRRINGTPAARAYSLVGDPADRAAYTVAVLRQGEHGVSAWLHAQAPGARLRVEAPRNDFPLAEAAEHVLLAGGIGITPILAMVRDLAARGAEFAVHYAARSPARMAFREEMRTIAGSRLTTWLGSAGARLDIPAAIGSWTFGAAPGVAERGFTVDLAQSRISITVAPGENILDRLFAVGVLPSFDCRRGACGACLARVVAGEPDHRDTYLTEAERAAGAFMTVCVSRSNSDRLVLDL